MLARLVQRGGISAISRQLGASPASTLAAARALMPGILDGLREFPGGIPALLDLFAETGGVALAVTIMGQDPVDTTPGEAIIARIGGIVLSDDESSQDDAALRLRAAPLLAMLVTGYLSSQATAGLTGKAELADLLRDDEAPKPSALDEDAV